MRKAKIPKTIIKSYSAKKDVKKLLLGAKFLKQLICHHTKMMKDMEKNLLRCAFSL